MPSRLEQIIATHRAMAAADVRMVADLIHQAEAMEPPRSFRSAIEIDRGISIISEIKRRSPSRGDLNTEIDPATLAQSYERGGATCLSVLTDAEFFGGSPEDLQAAREAVALPVLRKDFTVSELDVVDARLMGADAILLIVAALEDEELWRFSQLARRLQLDAIFEVHNENEIERAVRCEANIIGVNQRNLHTFEIDKSLALALREIIPPGSVAIAESGIETEEEAQQLQAVGYDAILVGSSLVTSADPEKMVKKLRGEEVG